jgi:hypothetical protein
VETGHATLGRTPAKVKVLTGACALAAVLVVGMLTVTGGARLVYLLLHPAQAQAIEDAAKAAEPPTLTEPPTPTAPPAPQPPSAPPASAPPASGAPVPGP